MLPRAWKGLLTCALFRAVAAAPPLPRRSVARCDMATIGPALFNFIDEDGDGVLTTEECIMVVIA